MSEGRLVGVGGGEGGDLCQIQGHLPSQRGTQKTSSIHVYTMSRIVGS